MTNNTKVRRMTTIIAVMLILLPLVLLVFIAISSAHYPLAKILEYSAPWDIGIKLTATAASCGGAIFVSIKFVLLLPTVKNTINMALTAKMITDL
jgi:hypothetical protein